MEIRKIIHGRRRSDRVETASPAGSEPGFEVDQNRSEPNRSTDQGVETTARREDKRRLIESYF